MKYLLAATCMAIALFNTSTNAADNLDEVIKKDSKLRRELNKIKKEYKDANEDLEEAKKDHAKKMAELKKETIEAYEDSMKRYTKKGDIRAATALMEKVDAMKKGEGESGGEKLGEAPKNAGKFSDLRLGTTRVGAPLWTDR